MVENVPGDVQHEKALVGEEVVSFFGQILWAVGAGTKGDCCEFKRRQVIYLLYLSLGRGVEEA